MELKSFSASRIGTWEQCQLQYKFKYIDGLPSKAGPAAAFGSFLHEVFEQAVLQQREPNDLVTETLKNHEVDQSYMKSIPGIIRNFEFIDKQLKTETPLVEVPFEISLAEGLPPVRGYIDRIVKYPSKTLILDYKTGKIRKDSKTIRKDRQMILYVLAAHKLYDIPVEDITAALFYVKFGKVVSVSFGETEIWDKAQATFDRAREIMATPPEKAKPSITRLCDYCDFKDQCEARAKYKKLTGGGKK